MVRLFWFRAFWFRMISVHTLSCFCFLWFGSTPPSLLSPVFFFGGSGLMAPYGRPVISSTNRRQFGISSFITLPPSALYRANRPILCARLDLLPGTSFYGCFHGSVDTNKLSLYMDFPFLAKNSSNDELPDFRILSRIAGTFPGRFPCAYPPWISILASAGTEDIVL